MRAVWRVRRGAALIWWLALLLLAGAAALGSCTSGDASAGGRALVGHAAAGGPAISVQWSCNPVKGGVQQGAQHGSATLTGRESTLFSADAGGLMCDVLKTSDGDLYLAIKQDGQFVSGKESTGGKGDVYLGP